MRFRVENPAAGAINRAATDCFDALSAKYGLALEPPRIIPHSAPINKPVPDVFKTLKAYFSDRLESKFELVSADEKTGTIVAKQTGIDSARWRTWAACETDPIHMIYQLNDAIVTLTIKLDQARATPPS